MPASSWLIGAITPQGESFQVDDGLGLPVDITIPSTEVYLHDPTSALSLLDAIAAELATALGGPATVTLHRDRLIRIDLPTVADILWGSATDIRDALGFSADCTGDSTYTADNPSPHSWCPGLTELSEARLGREGIPVYDTQIGGGGSFELPVRTRSNYRVLNTLEWRNVHNGRVWVDGTGGEHYAFWQTVLLPGTRFVHYRGLTNDESSSAELTLTSGARVGPYITAERSGDDIRYEYERSIVNVESRNNVKHRVRRVQEIS